MIQARLRFRRTLLGSPRSRMIPDFAWMGSGAAMVRRRSVLRAALLGAAGSAAGPLAVIPAARAADEHPFLLVSPGDFATLRGWAATDLWETWATAAVTLAGTTYVKKPSSPGEPGEPNSGWWQLHHGSISCAGHHVDRIIADLDDEARLEHGSGNHDSARGRGCRQRRRHQSGQRHPVGNRNPGTGSPPSHSRKWGKQLRVIRHEGECRPNATAGDRADAVMASAA